LGDLGAVKTKAARIILGAAVIDDVLGLVILAVVSGVIATAATGSSLSVLAVVVICVKAVAFLAGAVLIGGFLSPRLFLGARVVKAQGVIQALSLSFCFALSYLAVWAGLAPIVGAFAAGLVLEEVHFKEQVERGERPLHESLVPLTGLLVPVFFVRMGMLGTSLLLAGSPQPPCSGGCHPGQVGLRSGCTPGHLRPDHRSGHDAAGRGGPDLRGHWLATDAGRAAGGRRPDLRCCRLHGDQHYPGHAAGAGVGHSQSEPSRVPGWVVGDA
jgi:hypothetical protein